MSGPQTIDVAPEAGAQVKVRVTHYSDYDTKHTNRFSVQGDIYGTVIGWEADTEFQRVMVPVGHGTIWLRVPTNELMEVAVPE